MTSLGYTALISMTSCGQDLVFSVKIHFLLVDFEWWVTILGMVGDLDLTILRIVADHP